MPDDQSLLGPIRRLYVQSLREHGVTSQAVGWKDEASQQLRFEKLATVIDANLSSFCVNDLGSGYGAMFDFLAQRFGSRLVNYVGVDLSAEMVDAASGRISDVRARFVHGQTLSCEADYTFVSGTFNVKMTATAEQWTEYVQNTLLHLGERSTRGFAFNLLTDQVDWRADHLYYADPRHFFEFCRKRVSRSVTLFHDYPLYEWTIVVRK